MNAGGNPGLRESGDDNTQDKPNFTGGLIPHMPVSAERYKELLSHVAGGVAVITTGDLSGVGGRAWAFTAISYCGVSLDPPLVLFCLERSADCHEAFLASDRFAINILAAD